jgi:SAM-dependent methyltransferase
MTTYQLTITSQLGGGPVKTYTDLQVARNEAVGAASDFLEHLAPGREIIDFWNEAYRVLAPGGWFVSHTPSTDGRGAWQDPTHLSGWNENSFLYATHRDQQQYVDGLHARFQAINVRTGYPSTWHEQHKVTYVDADLCALKGQRQPGPCHI